MNLRCVVAILVTILGTTTTACAPTEFVPVVESPEDRGGAPVNAAESVPKTAADGVHAVVAATCMRTGRVDAPGFTPAADLPDGLRWEGDVLIFDPRRYQLLGTVRADMAREGLGHMFDALDDKSAAERRQKIVTTLRRATMALGGDFVVAVLVDLYVGKGDYGSPVPQCRPDNRSPCERVVAAMGGYGFSLRRLAR
jgi:hypothetical protein